MAFVARALHGRWRVLLTGHVLAAGEPVQSEEASITDGESHEEAHAEIQTANTGNANVTKKIKQGAESNK